MRFRGALLPVTFLFTELYLYTLLLGNLSSVVRVLGMLFLEFASFLYYLYATNEGDNQVFVLLLNMTPSYPIHVVAKCSTLSCLNSISSCVHIYVYICVCMIYIYMYITIFFIYPSPVRHLDCSAGRQGT